MALSKFARKADQLVSATQITLPDCELRYQKWGGEQAAKTGDWIVSNGDNTYTVEQESFAATYQRERDNLYRKVGNVWAEVAHEEGKIATKEGHSAYKAGDYLVYNNADGTDGYTISKEKFTQLYQPFEATAMQMQASDYLSQRVEEQISWYAKKSNQNQRRFKQLQIMSIIFGSTIPLLTALSFEGMEILFRFIIAFLGSLIAVISGLMSLQKFQENWVKYRATAEALRREKYFFLTRTAQYADTSIDNFSLLVERCEAIMSNEQTDWSQTVLPTKTSAQVAAAKT